MRFWRRVLFVGINRSRSEFEPTCLARRQKHEFRLKYTEPIPHDVPATHTVSSQSQPRFITMTNHEDGSDTTVLAEHISQISLGYHLRGGLYNCYPLLRKQGLDELPESATEVKLISGKFLGNRTR